MRTARQVCSGRAWQAATLPFKVACASIGLPCALCGQPIDYVLRYPHRRSVTVDHRVPLWAGGPPLDPSNWQPAHRSCNSSRGAIEGNRLRGRRARTEHVVVPTDTTARWGHG